MVPAFDSSCLHQPKRLAALLLLLLELLAPAGGPLLLQLLLQQLPACFLLPLTTRAELSPATKAISSAAAAAAGPCY
jgi:hypothetical protein